MDRTNLSAAAIAGMNAELKLNIGFRYVRIDNLVTISFAEEYRTPLHWSSSLHMSSFSLQPRSYAERLDPDLF